MKQQLNEVKKLQKIAGIISENQAIEIPGEINSLEDEGQFPKMKEIGRAIDRALDGSGIENLGYVKGLIRTFALLHKTASDE
jgi:hypothetical protein